MTVSMRFSAQFLVVSCLLSIRSASAASRPAPMDALGSPPSEDLFVLEEEEQVTPRPESMDEDASYRSSDEWWKDPFAYFDDDEEEEQEEREETLQDDTESQEMGDASASLVEMESEAIADSFEEQARQEEEEDDDDQEEKELEALVQQEIENTSRQRQEEPEQNQDEDASIEEPPKNKSIVPIKKNTGQNLAKDLASSVSAPAAILLPILPKVGTFLTKHTPFRLLGAAALIKVLMAKQKQQQQPRQESMTAMGESLPSSSSSQYDDLSDYDEIVEEQQQQQQDVDNAVSGGINRMSTVSEAVSSTIRPTMGLVQRVLNVGSRPRMPSAKQLLEERDVLAERVKVAESERDNMEREYEKTSWQLQEVQSDLAAQASTTRYLKAQLRENQQIMERTVRAERARAKEELGRMKEAMLRALDRERQAMRDEVQRQTAELQTLLNESAAVSRDS